MIRVDSQEGVGRCAADFPAHRVSGTLDVAALPELCCRRFATWDVYLDLRRDRYFCVAKADEAPDRARGIVSGATVVRVEDFVSPVREVGFRSVGPERVAVSVPYWRLLGAAVRVSCALQFQSLSTVLSRVRARRLNARGPRDSNLERLRNHMVAFQTLRPWIPPDYRCLFDSLMAADHLATFGWFPTLVLGVQAEPFEAHCWLQEGDVVVNDALDRVEYFSPILAV